MIDAILDATGGVNEAVRGLLRGLLAQGVVDALLVPMAVPGGTVAPMLVSDAAALERAEPLAPVLPINAARAVQGLTATGRGEKLGVVLRSCEIRALVELVKFQQAKVDDVVMVGIDCLGTYKVADYQAADQAAVRDGLVGQAPLQSAGQAPGGELAPYEGLSFRAACRMCEQPVPAGEHVAVTVGLLGVPGGQVAVRARDDIAAALGLSGGEVPRSRAAAVERLVALRVAVRDGEFAAFRARVAGRGDLAGLLAEFGACIRCHNCMVNCPICYCKECIFRTATFEHESGLYYQWAARKGSVRLLPDTLLFHLTRLNHMATSCVGCGVCTEACPVDIPVGTVFRAVGEKVQGLFDYHPGRSLAEAAPVQEFREDELTALGERPH